MHYKPNPKQELYRPVTESDMIDFIGSYIDGDKLGVIANSHLAHADGQENGIFSQQCIRLAQMHSDAVDFPKTGLSVQIPTELRPQEYPHYMLKRYKPSYRSEHVLGKLYDQCHSIVSNRGEDDDDLEAGIDDQFLVPGHEDYLDVAQPIHDYYRRNVLRLMGEYGITTEAEVVTGCFVKLKQQRRGTLQREHVEIAEIVNSRLIVIRAKVKDMFVHAVNDQSNEINVKSIRLASAVYFVTYTDRAGDGRCRSLPWVFADHLLSARRLNASPERAKLPIQQSVIKPLSNEIVDFKQSSDRLLESCRVRRAKAFQRLSSVIAQRSNVQVVLAVFGSHATGLDDTASGLDVLVHTKSHETSPKIFGGIASSLNLLCERPLTIGVKPIILTDDVNRVNVCLYTSETCIKRTVYIIATVANNAWIFPVLQTMLAWAKQNKIAGNDRDSTMTVEELILLFLSYLSQNVADHQQVDAADKSRVMDLLVQNHFVKCRAFACCHAKKPGASTESTNRYHYGDDRYADIILTFLSRCSCLQGGILKEVVDPACDDGGTKLFNLKEWQYHRLAERMLKAHYTLAQRGRLVDLISGSKPSDRRLVIDLPQQVCRRISIFEKRYAANLKAKSNARMLTIRRRPFRDSPAGLVLEAWGSRQSLQLINDFINDEAKMKPSLFTHGATNFFMKNAKVIVFKNCSSQTSLIEFVNYSKPRLLSHYQSPCRVPHLRDPTPECSFSREKFVERSVQQLNQINANYHYDLHGELRAVISYGTFYVANCRNLGPLPESDFDALYSESQSAAGDSDTAYPPGQGRGPQKCVRGGSQPANYIRSSFIPAGNPNIDSEHLKAILQNSGFVLAEETVEYRVTLKLSISGQQLMLDVVVVLDENFNLKYVDMPDIKWLCVDIVSANKDSDNKPYDCRFRIHSRPMRTAPELRQEPDDFVEILAKHRTMILRTGNEVHGVHPDFQTRARFMLKKRSRVYKLEADQCAAHTDPFLYGMTVKVSDETHYSRLSSSGTFQDVDRNRVEVTATPALPAQDEDEMRTFFNRCWEFAEELGSILQ